MFVKSQGDAGGFGGLSVSQGKVITQRYTEFHRKKLLHRDTRSFTEFQRASQRKVLLNSL